MAFERNRKRIKKKPLLDEFDVNEENLKDAKQFRTIYISELSNNIELNNADSKITIMPCALGPSGSETNISYEGRSNRTLCLSLQEMINYIKQLKLSSGGHVDFLKCDCEGGEWSITIPELLNIRRIEVEVHNLDHKHNFRDFEDLLIGAGFDYEKRIRNGTILISAKNRYIP